MTGPDQRPLLFLDVDGPLIPFGATPQQRPIGYPTYRAPTASRVPDANPLLARINPAHGPRLAALPCDLVWATTWMAEANECVAPRLGLPELPVVDWPEPSEEDDRHGLHWKTRALVARAAGRAFVWVDDEITDADRSWVAARHPGQALLHRVDPGHGLTDPDFTALDTWLRQTATAPPPHDRKFQPPLQDD
ncbi:HAD domain-containing protein [Streptomyces sp. NPDC006733]|uniref:HAD domain-containing protein n=1 Tax=Streptomyces sp. NPDC006733 TaxID=3155460 RepID=UPI0033D88182